MTNAREWLNNNIPADLRENVEDLLIKPTSEREENNDFNFCFYTDEFLTGTLDLTGFNSLKKLDIEKKHINHLILTGCRKLENLCVNNCLLRDITFPQRARNLSYICLMNNNVQKQNLSCFARFPNLESLFLGTDDASRLNLGTSENSQSGTNPIYNRWNGSLIYLKDLDLIDLDINATNIDEGLDHLPTYDLSYFTFGNKGRREAGVDRLKAVIEEFVELGEGKTIEDWAAEEGAPENHEKTVLINRWQQNQQQAQVVQAPPILVRRI